MTRLSKIESPSRKDLFPHLHLYPIGGRVSTLLPDRSVPVSLALSLFCKIVLALWGSLLWNSRLPSWPRSTDSACQCRRCRRCGFDPWVGKIPWKRKWQLTPVFLPGESHGQRSLAGYSPWAHKESATSEPLSVHTHLNSVQSLGCPSGSPSPYSTCRSANDPM